MTTQRRVELVGGPLDGEFIFATYGVTKIVVANFSRSSSVSPEMTGCDSVMPASVYVESLDDPLTFLYQEDV